MPFGALGPLAVNALDRLSIGVYRLNTMPSGDATLVPLRTSHSVTNTTPYIWYNNYAART